MKVSFTTTLRFIERHILGFGIGVAVLIILLGGLLLVVPRYQEVKELGGLNYTRTQNQVDAQERYLNELRDLRDKLNTISPDDIARLSTVVPRGKDVPGIFKQMQAFAKAAHMDLQSISVSEGGAANSTTGATPAPSGSLRVLTVSVVLNGTLDYNGLKNFLSVVSRQAPLLDLTTISHAPGGASAPNTYSFSFRSYFFEG